MDHLGLAQALTSEFDKKVEQSAVSTELTNDADLVNSWRRLFDLRLVDGDYVVVMADLSPHLHLICDQLTLLLTLRNDLFKGILGAGLRVGDCVDKAKASLGDQAIYFQ